MKQLLSVCAGPLSALMAALALCAPLHRAVDAGIDPATDYGEAMIDAAAAGDEEAGRAATMFRRLVEAGKRLMTVISHNQGGANKDLAKFASQIDALCEKWDR